MDIEETNHQWKDTCDVLNSGGYKITDLFALTAACYVSRDWPEEPLWILAIASPGSGKAIALDTPIPTPNGWKQNGDLEVGDKVYGGDGKICNVVGAYQTYHDHKCYEVTFSDGTSIIADADHLWETYAKAKIDAETYSVKTTQQIKDTLLRHSRKTPNHTIRDNPSIEGDKKNLPVPPYTLGVWIGDGNNRDAKVNLNTNDQEEIVQNMEEEGVSFHKFGKIKNHTVQGTIGRSYNDQSLHTKLRKNNLLNNKHIPEVYMRSSVSQRTRLLQGLMDTDGHTGKENGRSELYTSDPELADQFFELIASLGLKPSFGEGRTTVDGKDYGSNYRISFRATNSVPPHKISRKLSNVKYREDCSQVYRRRIESIEEVDTVPVRCIKVDSPNHLYLAGKNMIPTHNTCTINQFKELSDIEIVSAVTPAGLISGWGGEKIDNSLFNRIDRKLLIAKDFGTILSMSSQEIGKVFSYLREAFDGDVKKTFGMMVREYHDLHFNFLAVTTRACENVQAFSQQLGERFLRFDIPVIDLPSPPPTIDPSLRGIVQEWINTIDRDSPPQLTNSQHQWIGKISSACSKLRTEVIHDNYSKEIKEIPNFEGSARLEKQLKKLFQGLMVVMGDEDETKRLCKETARSCVPPRKVKLLRFLLEHDQEECQAQNIADEMRHGYNMIRRLLNDMWALELVDRDRIDYPKTYIWEIADEYRGQFETFLEKS